MTTYVAIAQIVDEIFLYIWKIHFHVVSLLPSHTNLNPYPPDAILHQMNQNIRPFV